MHFGIQEVKQKKGVLIRSQKMSAKSIAIYRELWTISLCLLINFGSEIKGIVRMGNNRFKILFVQRSIIDSVRIMMTQHFSDRNSRTKKNLIQFFYINTHPITLWNRLKNQFYFPVHLRAFWYLEGTELVFDVIAISIFNHLKFRAFSIFFKNILLFIIKFQLKMYKKFI